MDLESVQLLNLSPIPELSEVELSAMLEQLSNLSDINCDLSDRNVEDLLKQAEILIDESNNSKIINDAKILKDNSASSKTDDGCNKPVEESTDPKSNDELEEESDNLSVSKETTTNEYSKHSGTQALHKFSDAESENLEDSLVEKFSKSTTQTDSTINHIKSTIDSLREYSNMIEKKTYCRNSPKSKVINEIKAEIQLTQIQTSDKEDTGEKNDLIIESKPSPKLIGEASKKSNSLNELEKRGGREASESHNLAKSKKILNCFERLYQGKPVRLSLNHKKPKFPNREQKIFSKNSSVKNFKKPTTPCNEKKSSQQSTKAVNKVSESSRDTTKKATTNLEKIPDHSINHHHHHNSLPLIFSSDEMELEDWCKDQFNSNANFDEKKEKIFPSPDRQTENSGKADLTSEAAATLLELKNKTYEVQSPDFLLNFGSEFIQKKNQEKIIFHLLQEMEEIKDQLKKVEIRNSDQVSKKKNDEEVHSAPKSDEPCTKEQENSELNKSEGIRKLEQQFSMLKDKYDKQMEKLEKENQDLKKALISRQNILLQEINNYDIPSSSIVPMLSRNAEFSAASIFSKGDSEKNFPQYYSPENIKAPKNTPNTSFCCTKDLQDPSFLKHVCSQTEQELQNRSIQCTTNDEDLNAQNQNLFEGAELSRKEVVNKEAQKTENKENLLQKKKLSKCKLFSDVNNVYQVTKPKKVYSEHETRLMATVKGLQAEASDKEKENRKLKTEIDMLKAQMKRLGRNKTENPKKNQTGTQTIAFGPFSQQPYNPEVYEVPRELELENENLKLKIKSLESSLEMLKEKRIHDLQSLHKVHEEEMAKLLSKLETQSDLTKHLHSLLIAR